ncbi:hypothetical protein [Fibrobacter succinogenes]|uniref:hypothetical protein n=1 Tax=Fibrobacter succinogenes TaxID=833 RepID=UPI001566346F|nr:hypothetical protein [Fibrobacter succinogenes]
MVFFKVAGVAAFGLSLTLTACDHSSNNNLGFAAEDDLFASASSSSGDLGSSASTEGLKKYMTWDKTIEGLYLKYLFQTALTLITLFSNVKKVNGSGSIASLRKLRAQTVSKGRSIPRGDFCRWNPGRRMLIP